MMRKLLYSFLLFIFSKSSSKRTFTTNLRLLCFGMFFVVNFGFAQSAYITQRGGSTTANTTSNSTLTITKPTGVVEGDVMIVNIAQVGSNTLSSPSLSGWTAISSSNLGVTSNPYRWGAVLYKIATASEPTSYSFSLNSNSTATIGSMVAFSGVDISNPLDVAATSNNNGASTLTVSGLTTVTPNAALIMFAQSTNSSPTLSNWTTANSGNLTELYDDRKTSGTQATVGAAWLNTVGAVTNTGNGSVTFSNNSGRNGAVLVALRPYTYKSLITGVNTGSTNWCAGETRNVTVTIQNTGTATWNDGPSRDFNIGIKWNTNGSSWSDYNVRVDAQNLAPGDTRTYTFSITASDNTGGTYGSALAAGTNRLTFDVVFEQVAWFGNNTSGTGPGNSVYTTPNQTIQALPVNRTVTAVNSNFCAGNSTSIRVANSVNGVSYQLRDASNANIGSPINGNGGNLDLPTGILNTTTTFNVLATNAASCSAQMTTTPTVTVNPLPTTSNAGPNQNGSGPFTLAANTPSAGTGVWAIVSGPNTSTSQLSSTSSPTATFTPIGTGTYVLSWTISNSCGSSTSQVTIVANCVSNLLKNGNFNNGTTDWSAATGRGIYTEVLTEGLYFSNGSPNNTAELDSEASLRQQVTVIPNTAYTLSFIYARRPGSQTTVGVTARILAGTTNIGSVSYSTTDTNSTAFIGTLTFTPTTSTIFVELYNTLSTTTLGSIVDNIVLTPSPQVAPVAITSPRGSFATLNPVCAGTAVQLDVDNVPASGVTYSWSSTSPGAVFSSTTIKNPTVTFASTLTGIQEVTVVVTPTTGCAGAPSSTYVNLIAAPTVYNVTGGTTTCFGTGVAIGLSGSSANVSYQLQLDGANNGAAVVGTGAAISFGTKTAAGTYTVIATNITPNTCSLTMGGNAIIKAIQATPSVVAFTDIDCVNATGTIRLGNLPSGAWTINQTGQATATLTGSGTPYDVTGLAAGSYTFTVQTATTCASVATSPQTISDNSTSTWNGSTWVGGAPTASKRIIIASGLGTPFPTGTPVVNGCSLTVNSGVSVIVQTGVTLVITNAVTTNGQLTFRSGSSLMQTTNVGNTGQINYERTTNVRRLDATYWSMPVTNTAFTMATLSPNTLNDKYYWFDPTSTWTVNLNGTMPMEVGKGYNIRAPQPYDTNTPAPFTGVFVGVPNNGPISPTVVQDRYNLVGNPYPSAISASALINGNTNLGTLYFWTHNSSPVLNPADGKYYYNDADFAAFNLTGGTDTSSGANLNGQPFQGYIAAGQGFLARPKTTTLSFTNAMRRSGNNTQFYKTGESEESGEIERNRLWLNFSNDFGAFKQALIGYIEGATNSFDINFDANTLGSNTSADFYSINESNNMTIQGRALPFDNKDIVPLGYKAASAGEYTISIDHADGIFDTQEVYLEDLLVGKTVSLRSENYKFTTAIGTFTNRFNLRYTSKTLGTGEFEDLENSVVVSLKNKVLRITSSKETIKDVNIYNVGAQLLCTKTNINSAELQISNLNSGSQVLLVKITLENGHTLTKKVVYSNL